MGRFSVIHDPHDAAFVLFKGQGSPQPKVPAQTLGHVGWHELSAKHAAEAMAFYTSLFGWSAKGSLDMGPMGTYHFFATDDEPVGGIFTKPPDMPSVAWHLYFNVEAIDAAAARVTQNGGKIRNPPHQVPGGSWIAHASDPRGAMFGLVAAKK